MTTASQIIFAIKRRDKQNCKHEFVCIDQFARDFPGSRRDGDCICVECLSPMPVFWESISERDRFRLDPRQVPEEIR